MNGFSFVRGWFQQLVSAAQHLIDNKTWHGDIKPDNIVVTKSGHLVLIDLTSKYTTVAIASPEVMEVAKKTRKLEVPAVWSFSAIEKAEVYSIGRTMFFVYEGVAMRDIYTGKHGADGPPTAFSVNDPASRGIRSLILDCVSESASRRPTLDQVASRLCVLEG